MDSLQQKHFILSPEASIRTFDFDDKLPALPVPSLEKTIQRYLKSVRPFAENEDEYARTKNIANLFQCGVGASLHNKLLQHASKHKNWLEKWWEDYAYLSLREPLLPRYNMTCSQPLLPNFQYGPGQQIKIAAAYCYQTVKLWRLLREERLQPATTSSKLPFSMDQFRKVFNCSVDPGITKDSLRVHFKTEKEGSCSSLVGVLCNGHIFLVDGIHLNGEPLTMAEWEIQLSNVKQRAKVSRGPDIPCLAADTRNRWAQNKNYLANLSPGNASTFAKLDSAMFVMCLDDMNPESEEAVAQLVALGNYSCRWPDIATSIVVFDNGLAGGVCLHSPFDGIVSATVILFIYSGIKETLNNNVASSVATDLTEPQHVNFNLDQTIKNEIKRVKTDLEIEKKKFALCLKEFTLFGKKRIQRFKMHPDSFMQMVLQLAYYKLHSKFAPCYETATTRTFYHGRTETVRSCSEDYVLWVKSMLNPQQKNSERAALLRRAIQTHDELMKQATNGEGCDRHLFGLYCLAMENGMPVPDLFTDPLFSRSGGNGNFVLSTSLLGYSGTSGAVAPMCLHGYGIFYSILPDRLLLTMTTRTDNNETSLSKMFQSISSSLEEVANILDLEPSANL